MKRWGLKVAEAVIFLLLLSFFSFSLMKLAPGDPVMSMLRVDDIAVSKADVSQLREELGLNLPIPVQYGHWIMKVVQLDFGKSVLTGRGVLEELVRALPKTLMLAGGSLTVALGIAVPLGIFSATYPGSWIDKCASALCLLGASIPGFWLGLILVNIFAVKLNWLPAMGMGTPVHLILPSLTLGISICPPYMRLIRSSLLQSKTRDYIWAARARGVSEHLIFWNHLLRDSLIPVVTVFGLSLGSLLGGTVIIEVIFSYPGIGKLAVEAILRRDYAIIQGFVLLTGLMVFFINILLDGVYRIIDPTISIKEAECS